MIEHAVEGKVVLNYQQFNLEFSFGLVSTYPQPTGGNYVANALFESELRWCLFILSYSYSDTHTQFLQRYG
jgi:hypothetical protein